MRKTPSSSQSDSVGAPITKKRRGRQPRASLVSSNLHRAVTNFTALVGCPIYQPGGFRDILGWVGSISDQRFDEAWANLSRCFIQESNSIAPDQIPQLKKDVVTEIMTLVVTKQPHECNKLVSTNARRQCKIPAPGEGSTVMTLLEGHLRRVGSTRGNENRREGAHRGSSGIDIASLLTDAPKRNMNQLQGSSMLPPFSQFDEQVRQHRERNSRDRRSK